MNAMWGAGQMMFNKILVLADQHTKIQDYEALAKAVFKNLDVVNDITYSNGPMDVLDHSCSKLGFGGKMGIDGTTKFEEEDEQFGNRNQHIADVNALKSALLGFSEIHHVNVLLPLKEIPCIVVSVQKSRVGHVRELHQQITEIPEMQHIKMVLYVEHTVDADDLTTSLWRLCNNLDPKRDHVIAWSKSSGKPVACLGLDGTRKTREFDQFERDWPNIIVSNDKTIEAVDAKWDKLGLGAFLPSPSLKFKSQIYGEEAVVA
jgi:4-hydroxy-3-polyprenylbenzoate decarboxylase